MRIPLTGLFLVSTLSWAITDASAQPPPPRGQEPGRPPRPEDYPDGPPPPPFGPPPNLLFMAIDTDGDGELSTKEVAKAAQAIAKLDKNKDGLITEDEVRPPPPPGAPLGPPGSAGGPPAPVQNSKALVESVMKYDKDGDGKVTAKELPERMARMLEEGDTNKDNALQRSEIEALTARVNTNRRPGPPGEAPPGGGPPGGQDEDRGRPVEAIARELGVTPEKFREVFRKVTPAGPGQQPTQAQRQRNRKILSEGLGVSPEKLDEVMDKYRPGGRGDNGPPPPPPRN